MMLNVFFSPTQAFTRLKDKPSWWLPLLITVLVTLVVTVVSTRYFDWETQRQRVIEQLESRNMTPEQIEQATAQMEKFWSSPIMRFGMPVASALVMQLAAVFVLALIYNLAMPLLGSTGNYLRSLSVVCLASLVSIPAGIVKVLLVLLKRSAEVSTSLLLAAPNLKSGFLQVLFSRVDPFAFWQLILMALGLKVVFDLKGPKSYLMVFIVWLAFTLIFASLGLFRPQQ